MYFCFVLFCRSLKDQPANAKWKQQLETEQFCVHRHQLLASTEMKVTGHFQRTPTECLYFFFIACKVIIFTSRH